MRTRGVADGKGLATAVGGMCASYRSAYMVAVARRRIERGPCPVKRGPLCQPPNEQLQRTVILRRRRGARAPRWLAQRAAAELRRCAMPTARQLMLCVLFLGPIIAVSSLGLAQQSITGRPFDTSEELRKVASELVTLIESKHACDLEIDATPRLDGPFGLALVWYTSTGDECAEAQAELTSRAYALGILLILKSDPPKRRNDNLTLLK